MEGVCENGSKRREINAKILQTNTQPAEGLRKRGETLGEDKSAQLH